MSNVPTLGLARTVLRAGIVLNFLFGASGHEPPSHNH